jgi:hypothetical protein
MVSRLSGSYISVLRRPTGEGTGYPLSPWSVSPIPPSGFGAISGDGTHLVFEYGRLQVAHAKPYPCNGVASLMDGEVERDAFHGADTGGIGDGTI